jgi:hypothetical protein
MIGKMYNSRTPMGFFVRNLFNNIPFAADNKQYTNVIYNVRM